jgi:hypothetical protein
MSVLHGTGKPRFEIDFGNRNVVEFTITGLVIAVVKFDTVAAASVNLDYIENTVGLKQRVISGVNTLGGITRASIVSYDNTAKTLTVDAFNNGAAVTSTDLTISIYRIDLPYCQSLIERFTPEDIVRKLYNGGLARTRKGWRYSAILDYGRYATKEMIQKLRWLYRNDSPDFFWFYPRLDNLAVVYKVTLDPEYVVQLQQRQRHTGHLFFNILLIGYERLNNLPFEIETTSTGYGEAPYGGSANVGYGDN